jgi:hypothetical protein
MPADYCMQVCTDLATIGRAQWDALVAADAESNVLLRYDFLHALHETGAACSDTGWTPQYLILRHGAALAGAELAGAVPLYRKTHSYGEYVFDWTWADAYRRYRMAYYPKWLAAVPFSPVSGTRLIARNRAARAALADALMEHARASGLSSLHVLLAPQQQIELLAARGMLARRGVQFHWRNPGYASFDEFLARLTQPKRKKIRAERRHVAQAGVTLVRKTGAETTAADWRFFFRCYCATYAAHGMPPYLSLEFFERIGATLGEHVLLVLALRGRRPVASALGLFDQRGLYGRYWGALEPVHSLHFEACYYQMIEFAIERQLPTFEGGAQGAHKLARGLDPETTWSAHWLAEPAMHEAIANCLAREAAGVEQTIDELNEHRAFR